jgi:hypothetical protein
MSGIARIEARHLARSPLLWIGFALAAFGAQQGLGWPALDVDDLLAYQTGFLVSAGAVWAGAWLGLRDRATGAADLVAVTPTAPWRLWQARLAALVPATAAVFALLFGAVLAVSAARGGRGAPDLRLLADGMLAVVLSGWVGIAVGRLSGSRMVSVLVAPVWVSLSMLVGGQGQTEAPLTVQNLAPVLLLNNRSAAYGFPPDPLWPHLGYLLGLTVLVGALLVALAARGGGRRRLPMKAWSRSPRPAWSSPGRPGPGCSPIPTPCWCSGPTGTAGSPSRATSTPSPTRSPAVPAGTSPTTAARGPAPATRP